MPRETIQVLRCDRCSHEGTAYKVTFDDEGAMEFILCEKHNGPLEKLRGLAYGTWIDQKPKRKRGIQKVRLEDIERK